MLQMRGGYPDEEMTSNLFEIMFFQNNWDFVPHLIDFPLASDPGTEFHYSNLTSHLLGVIVTEAFDTGSGILRSGAFVLANGCQVVWLAGR